MAIGLIASFIVVIIVELLDSGPEGGWPVGAVAVHCGCGAMRTILTGVFVKGSYWRTGE